VFELPTAVVKVDIKVIIIIIIIIIKDIYIAQVRESQCNYEMVPQMR